jgi:hypothetical protein
MTPGRTGGAGVTTGTVAAVGRTRWLAVDCRHWHRCADIVIDSATGARKLLARHRIDVTVPGAISRRVDGRAVPAKPRRRSPFTCSA